MDPKQARQMLEAFIRALPDRAARAGRPIGLGLAVSTATLMAEACMPMDAYGLPDDLDGDSISEAYDAYGIPDDWSVPEERDEGFEEMDEGFEEMDEGFEEQDIFPMVDAYGIPDALDEGFGADVPPAVDAYGIPEDEGVDEDVPPVVDAYGIPEDEGTPGVDADIPDA